MWQSLLMAVNDLNCVSKKWPLNKIDENWYLFEHKIKITAYLTKLDEYWNQKGIFTFL